VPLRLQVLPPRLEVLPPSTFQKLLKEVTNDSPFKHFRKEKVLEMLIVIFLIQALHSNLSY
jgi:hypothetical protein